MTDLEKANLTDAQKAIALFSFARDMNRLKYNIVTNIEKQPWTLFLEDIPADGQNIVVYYRDKSSTDDADEALNDDVLISVHKAELQDCPKPPQSIVKWLSPGWDEYTRNVSIVNIQSSDSVSQSSFLQDDTVVAEAFDDSPQRVAAFNAWHQERSEWTAQQIQIAAARQLFSKIYQEYFFLQSEAGNMEFVVGDGVIRQAGNSDICHPLLLKRVRFEFDARNNTITIRDTDTEPELYTGLLQNMTDTIDTSVIRPLQDELHDRFYHPLDRIDTPDFLKRLTHNLCDAATFNDEIPGPDDKVSVSLSPVFFVRRKIDGALKAINDVINDIKEKDAVPSHLNVFIGKHQKSQQPEEASSDEAIEKHIARLSGESADILLAKEANREQLEIAERIEQYDAVLVQGPPGTGKTHTIANLLVHFLAQGKSVLVTSQTRKALTVLKEQVPLSMQSLCVTVLDDTKRDMERSVNGISEHLSNDTPQDLTRRIDTLTSERRAIIDNLTEVRKRIFSIQYQEYKSIAYNDESFSPSEMAKFVRANAERLSYIPGKVKTYNPLPLTAQELCVLYASNIKITQLEETELDYEIPSPSSLITPEEFSENLKIESECYTRLKEIEQQLGSIIQLNPQGETISFFSQPAASAVTIEPHRGAAAELRDYIDSFENVEKWMISAAVDGNKGSGYLQQWKMLISSIEETDNFAGSIVISALGKTIVVAPGTDIDQLKKSYEKLYDKFENRGKVSKLELLVDKKLSTALASVTINSKAPASADDCSLILRYLQLFERRTHTAELWDALMVPNGAPSFFSLDAAPESICKKRIPGIQRYLNWYENEYAHLLELIDNSGLRKDLLFDFSDLDSDFVRTEKIFKSVQTVLPLHIEVSQLFFRLKDIKQRNIYMENVLSRGSRRESSACSDTVNAIKSGNADEYSECYRNLSHLYAKYDTKLQRTELLEKLSVVAPDWANAIKDRAGIHGQCTFPDTVEDAWKWKQFSEIIEEITSEPFDKMQHQATELTQALRGKTAELAATSAWYHLICRCTSDSCLQQSLMGWKIAVKKIGKGTGKNAQLYRKTAQQQMNLCQKAVPAWIMPVSTAMESFNTASNKFDILIIDEASQSDLSALALMYMAKKVIIVGDDKQVSPLAVGVDESQISAIRDMYIKDVIPLWQLYGAKTSLYELASTGFKPLMLQEHFRCVPDIIGYCNKLSYDYKIKPLRDASSCNIRPSIVPYRVTGGQRQGRHKTNPKEAESVVALMQACMEQAEYEGKTFGVISLLGDEQAKAIRELIYRKIDISDIESRRILCGNAANFQGDERNVIFLSMVDSNEGDGPIRMAGEGVDQSTKQRYNVAVSRAKDQLWIVHSLDYTRDLKAGDIRRDLLEYADNPKAFARIAEEVEQKSESPFEKAVAQSLIAKGYHIVQQWQIGSGGYRIDIVVMFQGKKIAVECDGERWHSSEEAIRNDMARQSVLERMGWQFIRIRGSQYYRDSEGTMAYVFAELSKHGIKPEAEMETDPQHDSTELSNRVKTRAFEIIETWHLSEQSSDKKDAEASIVTPIVCAAPRDTNVNQIAFALDKLTKQSNVSHATIPDNRPVQKPRDNIVPLLRKAGFDFVDRREQSGIIWVLANPENDDVLKSIIESTSYPCKYEARGTQVTGNKPAWRIMIGN